MHNKLAPQQSGLGWISALPRNQAPAEFRETRLKPPDEEMIGESQLIETVGGPPSI